MTGTTLSPSQAGGTAAGGAVGRGCTRADTVAQAGSERGGMLRSLHHRDFRLFWLGLLMALTGFTVQRVGLGFLAYDLTGSAFYLTLVFLGDLLPMLLLSPLGGVVGDRVNRRLVLIVTRLTIAVSAIVVCVLVITGLIAAWQLLLFSLVTGVCYAFDLPARQALVRDLVPERDFVNAVALTSSAMQATRIVGPAIGGAALVLIGVGGTFALMALGQIGQVLMVVLLRAPHVRRPPSEGVLGNLREGVSFIVKRESIWLLLVISTIPALFAMNYMTLAPIFALNVLGRGEASIGVMYTAAGIGALAGSTLVAAHSERFARPRVFTTVAVIFSLLVALFALSRFYPLSLALLMLVGAAGSIYAVGNSSAVQAQTPREMQARVMSVYQMTGSAQVLGALSLGAAADAIGAPAALAMAGVVSAGAIGLLLLLRPGLRTVAPNAT